MALKSGQNKITDALKLAASKGKLVVIAGTGVSKAISQSAGDIYGWRGLIRGGLNYAESRGCITNVQKDFWTTASASNDLDEMLAAAEFASRKMKATAGHLYARWLQDTFQGEKCNSSDLQEVLKQISGSGIPIATLNYDGLIEEATGENGITLSDTTQVIGWMRRDNQSILHLHGRWDAPDTCVLGIRDYEETIGLEFRDLIQRSLSTFDQLLFVGCGDTFADPNFSALIRWLRANVGAAGAIHYALVHEDDLQSRLTDATWQGFVEPVSYENHLDVASILREITAATKPTRKATPLKSADDLQNEEVLNAYRAFLIRDSGMMTIEGMQADMEMTQRKFEIEKLFVPLTTVKLPPEISLGDPNREALLEEWERNNGGEHTFGDAFSKSKKIALLALPGGGKTLLLKRLAVAYADPTRRNASEDKLPLLDIFPVLIRCREWRDHIHKPIPSMLEGMANIVGQANVSGLYSALLPLLKKGKVLLLVDGLDEIHVDSQRATFVDNLERFLEEFSEIRLVVTSREAGFALVAPTLARFCDRWRVAQLSDQAITTLCRYWHRLMVGDTPEAIIDSDTVSQQLLKNDSIHRLAENPLLLTMLLVVKHGAGRLPPDRVSLYERAVEVLLNTWNIKGHEALNVKEAIPQLAYIAYEMMQAGKQTATEAELIALLEDAREDVPHIRRYAKDSPYDFLKRVELRSSLLIEAGLQQEGIKIVPFYQFRHLTFQEYLAAVASVEGHYSQYAKSDDIVVPLGDYLLAEEWKEVIPMAAVLAKKQAEPLITKINEMGDVALQRTLSELTARKEDVSFRTALPKAVDLLLQCLSEEAEASPETLRRSIEILVLHAKGCREHPNWHVLVKGPYGQDFVEHAWELYTDDRHPSDLWLRNTFSVASYVKLLADFSESGPLPFIELKKNLQSADPTSVRRALLTVAGSMWGSAAEPNNWNDEEKAKLLRLAETYLDHDDLDLKEAAIWAWGLLYDVDKAAAPTTRVLDLFTDYYFSATDLGLGGFVLGQIKGVEREYWTPVLTTEQRAHLVNVIEINGADDRITPEVKGAIVLCFYAGDVISETKLVQLIKRLPKRSTTNRPEKGRARPRRASKAIAANRAP